MHPFGDGPHNLFDPADFRVVEFVEVQETHTLAEKETRGNQYQHLG
jgi:hypothetical protein